MGGRTAPNWACLTWVRSFAIISVTDRSGIAGLGAARDRHGDHTFALECAAGELATELGTDPIDLRIRSQPDNDPIAGTPFSSHHADAVGGLDGGLAKIDEPERRESYAAILGGARQYLDEAAVSDEDREKIANGNWERMCAMRG